MAVNRNNVRKISKKAYGRLPQNIAPARAHETGWKINRFQEKFVLLVI